MTRLICLLLFVAALTLGSALAAQDAQEVGKEVDARTATEKGAEVDPALSDEAVPGDDARVNADTIETETEIEAAFEALEAESQDRAEWPNEASQFLATREDLSIFLMLLDQADLTESLAEASPVTIFAPSDAAFARMDAVEFESMLDDQARLRQFLENHIAAGTFTTARLSADLDAVGEDDAELAVAGGGQGEEMTSATVPAYDPSSFVQLETRAGADLAVGIRPPSVRSELAQLEQQDGGAAPVAEGDVGNEFSDGGRAGDIAGGGAAADVETTLYVDDARVVTRDLTIDGLTLHVIDRVLLPAEDDGALGQ